MHFLLKWCTFSLKSSLSTQSVCHTSRSGVAIGVPQKQGLRISWHQCVWAIAANDCLVNIQSCAMVIFQAVSNVAINLHASTLAPAAAAATASTWMTASGSSSAPPESRRHHCIHYTVCSNQLYSNGMCLPACVDIKPYIMYIYMYRELGKGKGKAEHLYSALHGTNHFKALRHGSHSF